MACFAVAQEGKRLSVGLRRVMDWGLRACGREPRSLAAWRFNPDASAWEGQSANERRLGWIRACAHLRGRWRPVVGRVGAERGEGRRAMHHGCDRRDSGRVWHGASRCCYLCYSRERLRVGGILAAQRIPSHCMLVPAFATWLAMFSLVHPAMKESLSQEARLFESLPSVVLAPTSPSMGCIVWVVRLVCMSSALLAFRARSRLTLCILWPTLAPDLIARWDVSIADLAPLVFSRTCKGRLAGASVCLGSSLGGGPLAERWFLFRCQAFGGSGYRRIDLCVGAEWPPLRQLSRHRLSRCLRAVSDKHAQQVRKTQTSCLLTSRTPVSRRAQRQASLPDPPAGGAASPMRRRAPRCPWLPSPPLPRSVFPRPSFKFERHLK